MVAVVLLGVTEGVEETEQAQMLLEMEVRAGAGLFQEHLETRGLILGHQD